MPNQQYFSHILNEMEEYLEKIVFDFMADSFDVGKLVNIIILVSQIFYK